MGAVVRAGVGASLAPERRSELDAAHLRWIDERLLVGGQGLAPGHPIQRAWRDVHAIAQHLVDKPHGEGVENNQTKQDKTNSSQR